MTNNEEQLNTVEEQLQAHEQIIEEAVETEEEIVNGEAKLAAIAKRRTRAEIAVNVALWIAIVVLSVAVILRLFVFSTVEVDGLSMNPTYNSGDVVTVNKTAMPKRGDVAVFYKNEVNNKFIAQFAKREECAEGQPYEKLIKRVVALGGDKIWVQRIAEDGNDVMYEVVIDTFDGNRLFENYYVKKGEVLAQETYYLHTDKGSDLGNLKNCTESDPFVVSEGCFFAMGDNRTNSKDSRVFGEFKLTQMFGVVLDK